MVNTALDKNFWAKRFASLPVSLGVAASSRIEDNKSINSLHREL